MRIFFLIFFSIYFITPPLFANGLSSEELAAWNQYLNESMLLAEKGDTDSQAMIGAFLLHGAAGVEKDSLRGLLLLEKASDKGHALAMFTLFEAYSVGRGVPKNIETSLMWLVKSAEGMNRRAQFLLAMKYMHGINFDKNRANSVKWLIRSAKLGHGQAQFILSAQYYTGRGGLAVDDIETYAWAASAASNPTLDSSPDEAIEFREKALSNLSLKKQGIAKEKATKYYELYVKPFLEE